MTDRAQLLALAQSGDNRAVLKAVIANSDMPDERRQLVEMMLDGSAPTDEPEPSAPHTIQELRDGDDHDRLARQNDALRAMLHDIGDALGACGACFGTDETCPDCDGDGAPGTWPPRRDAFEFFLRPVFDRLKRRPMPHAGSGQVDLKQRSETT